MSAFAFALAVAGGGAGSVLRFLADAAVRARWSREFPLATFAINVLGSLLLGLVVGVTTRVVGPSWVVILLGTGVLGGFTTFSTASVETVGLLQAGRWRTGVAYGLGSVVACWAAAGLGLATGAWAGS